MKKGREERLKNMKSAISIASLGGVEPCDFCKKLMEEYVDGKCTAEEVTEKLKAFYLSEERGQSDC